MTKTEPSKAEQIARAAIDFEEKRTGHRPKSVTVVLGEDTLVITLHGALSQAERALAKDPEGIANLQTYYRQLFLDSLEPLKQEIKRIAGVDVREATTEVEPKSGAVVKVFTSGTIVQVLLLDETVETGGWSGAAPEALD